MTVGLWEFSLAVYARPGVGPLCLSLQADLDADVNVVLCAAWVEITGRGRLGRAELAALDATVAELRRFVVKPLRGARVWLKGRLASDPALAPLREAVKRVELAAERDEQRMLELLAPPRRPGAGSVADAIANVETYLGACRGPAASAPDLGALRAALGDWLADSPGAVERPAATGNG